MTKDDRDKERLKAIENWEFTNYLWAISKGWIKPVIKEKETKGT